jgi:DNA-damage-inducible protein J
MKKTAIITARVDPELKQRTELVLRELGLTPTQAITLFYKQVNLHKGLPFPVNIPNAETRQAIEDAQEGRGLRIFNTPEKLFDDLGI